MAIILKDEKKNKTAKYVAEAGTVQAVCYAVWDLGNQENTWEGTTTIKHQVMFAWEIDQLIDDPENEDYNGKRLVLNKKYKLSGWKDAPLVKDLSAWRKKAYTADELLDGFDIESFVGQSCLLNISVNEKGYGKVEQVSPLMKGMKAMTPENNTEPPAWVLKQQSEQIFEEVEAEDSIATTGNIPSDTQSDLPF